MTLSSTSLASVTPDREQLQEIYTELDRIDTREVAAETYRPRTDLFHWPLAAFMLLGVLLHVGPLRKRRGEARQTSYG